jgi:hypothetical protein
MLTSTGSDTELVRLILMLKDRPHVARRLRELGPIYFENEHSIEACYHSLYQLLKRAGFLDQLGVRPNIGFAPPARRQQAATVTDLASCRKGCNWVPGAGVSGRENANPEHGYPTPFNWLEGPTAELVLRSGKEGRQRVVIAYQNMLFDEQLIEVSINDAVAMIRRLGRTLPHKVGAASFRADLCAGQNRLRIKFARWHRPDNDSRNLALLLNGILIL